jgi:hypothetical protein
LWIGFNFGGGLVRYRDGRFTRFTLADGLAEGGIFNLDSGAHDLGAIILTAKQTAILARRRASEFDRQSSPTRRAECASEFGSMPLLPSIAARY